MKIPGTKHASKNFWIATAAIHSSPRGYVNVYICQLSCAFLEDRPFYLDKDAQVDPAVRYIIGQALKASAIIDALEA